MNTNEEFLTAWLGLSTLICGERIVSDLPYNEALICNHLANSGADGLCATELCERTGMLKSLMNRTLNSMEQKGLIRRERSDKDKRQVSIFLQPNELYRSQHEKILRIVNTIVERYGKERSQALTAELSTVCGIVREVLG